MLIAVMKQWVSAQTPADGLLIPGPDVIVNGRDHDPGPGGQKLRGDARNGGMDRATDPAGSSTHPRPFLHSELTVMKRL